MPNLNLEDNKQIRHTSVDFSLMIGLFLAFIFLYFIVPSGNNIVRYENLALGKENTSLISYFEKARIHCQDINDFSDCNNAYKKFGQDRPVVLWLGNSQIHSINQYKNGEETVVTSLHRQIKNDSYLLALSQPNANLQEHYLLFSYLFTRLPLSTLILPLVFDDMREDGLRTGVAKTINYPDIKELLNSTMFGQTLIASHSNNNPSGNDMDALNDTVQEIVEKKLNLALENTWLLWKNRPALRGEIIHSLYLFRNWLLRINASSIRKVIPGRYIKNKNSFSAILELASKHGVKVLVYVAPLRNDAKIPYDTIEYTNFKSEFKSIAKESGARFINLENLIPGELWGTKPATAFGKSDQEIDFMHFQAGGHILLANSLYDELRNLRITP